MIVVFDFDGVLVDSNRLKREAYHRVFNGLDADKVIVRCLNEQPQAHRYEQIRRIVLELVAEGRLRGSTNLDQCVDRHGAEYTRICQAETARCDEIPGASSVLPALAADYPLYINSSTWEASLRRVVERRGWSDLFRAVLGAPHSKIENLQSIMLWETADARDVVFVGDSHGDYEAALSSGCRFVGIRNEQNNFQQQDLASLDDLLGLPALLGQLWPVAKDVQH